MAESKTMPPNQRGRSKLRVLLDMMLILATLTILFLKQNAIWIMLPLLLIYMLVTERDLQPKPKIVKRWNKQAGKYIYYKIDEKTGIYLGKVDENG